jgi:CheY-like chemotaxis protein
MASKKILLVDDDEMIRAIAKQSLETNGGFDVTVAASGEECLEVAGEIMPNLILMDVFMPGLDGPSTFQELRKNKVLTHIPVVFLTANTSEQDTERLIGMGAAGVMAKPFQPSELSSQMRQFLPNSSL